MPAFLRGEMISPSDDKPIPTTKITDPVAGAFSVVPSDTADLPRVTRQIYVGGAGNVSVIWRDGAESVEPVAAGDRLDWQVRRIKATGTTATNLRGYY